MHLYVVKNNDLKLAFTYTSGVFTICQAKKTHVLNNDGTYSEKEILRINMACDHRFIDGALGSKLLKEVKNKNYNN
jgi:hypothetical protein